MTDAPLTREEIERLLALCEADGAPLCETDALAQFYEAEQRTVDFANAARAALPRALLEALRLHDELAAWRVSYRRRMESHAILIQQLGAENDRLRRALDAAAHIAEAQPYYPGTHTCTRQQWVKDQIAVKIRALDTSGLVMGSDG